MTGVLRIAHRLAREPSTSPCARCLDFVVLAVGEWHAVDTASLERPVCDHCSRRDDPAGFELITSFRRMAAGPTAGRAGR